MPLVLRDSDGAYAKWVHRWLTRRALRRELRGRGLSFRERHDFIAGVVSGNIDVDRRGAVDPTLQHEHAMQIEGKTPEESRAFTNAMINSRLRDAIEAGRNGDNPEARRLLGEATHPIQDLNSPVHGFDRPWPEDMPLDEQMAHAFSELFARLGFRSDTNERADRAIAGTRALVRAYLDGLADPEWSRDSMQERDWVGEFGP